MATESTPGRDLQPPRGTRLRATLIGAAILLCGVVIGSAATTGILWNRLSRDLREPPVISARVADRIIERYDLPGDMRSSLEEILERHRYDVEAVRDSLRPMMDTLRVQFREEVAELMPGELADRWRADFDEDSRRWFTPGPRRDGRGPHGVGEKHRRSERRPPPPENP